MYSSIFYAHTKIVWLFVGTAGHLYLIISVVLPHVRAAKRKQMGVADTDILSIS